MLGFDNKEKHDLDRKLMSDVVWFPGYEEEYKA